MNDRDMVIIMLLMLAVFISLTWQLGHKPDIDQMPTIDTLWVQVVDTVIVTEVATGIDWSCEGYDATRYLCELRVNP